MQLLPCCVPPLTAVPGLVRHLRELFVVFLLVLLEDDARGDEDEDENRHDDEDEGNHREAIAVARGSLARNRRGRRRAYRKFPRAVQNVRIFTGPGERHQRSCTKGEEGGGRGVEGNAERNKGRLSRFVPNATSAYLW